jgi:hypothetical protein
LNISVEWINNANLIDYYKKYIIRKIEDQKQYNNPYTSIQDFIPLALYKEKDFIQTYFYPNTLLSNDEKLDYIKIYNLSWMQWEKVNDYIKDLKNAILVEARWSVLPADKSFSRMDNSVSSAKMIQVLIDSWNTQKLLLENLMRFLISNRDEKGNYYTYDFSQIIHAVNTYIEFTWELKNVDFEAQAFVNSKSIMTSKFGESNKFTIDKKTFDFWEYLHTGENSLWFEKTWSGKLYYDVWVRYYLPVSQMKPREEWMIITRNYYNYDDYKNAFQEQCITPWWGYNSMSSYCTKKKVKNIDSLVKWKKWEYIIGEIEIILDKERTNVVINDYIPAWAEILNTHFNTTSSEVKEISWEKNNNYWYGGFDFVEQRDDRIYLFANHLMPWNYTYTYVLKANHIWNYSLKPAIVELLDKPEIWGSSSGGKFEIQ